MSVFSYHIVRTSYINALRALIFPPKPTNVPGLIHAECMTAMTLGSPVFSPSRILMRELVMFAQWENEVAIDSFLKQHKFGEIMAQGWHTRLLLMRQWGRVTEFQVPDVYAQNEGPDDPVVAVTLARMKLPEVPRFIHWGRPVERLVRDHPAITLALASIRLPRTVSTFSIWRTQKEMTEMVHGKSSVPHPKRHVNAMNERDRKDFHFEFTTLRFKPISEHGEWNGKRNIIPTRKSVN